MKVFRVFIFQCINELVAVDTKTMLFIFLVFFTIIAIIFAFNFARSPFSYFVTWISVVIPFLQILSVPMCYFAIYNIDRIINNQNGNDSSTVAIRIIICIETIFILAFVGIYKYFSIRPIRFNNSLWNYDNNQPFLHYAFSLCRAIIFYIDKASILLLAISLILELRLQSLPSSYLNQKITIIVQCRYNL